MFLFPVSTVYIYTKGIWAVLLNLLLLFWLNCPVIWRSLLHCSWQVSGEYVGARNHPEEIPEKFNWPLSLTRISEHWYYLLHIHTDMYTLMCSWATRSTHSHTQINHSTQSALMMLLTLMRKGTRSWRQLTMLIMEISHWYPGNKPSCQWMSHRLTWMCVVRRVELLVQGFLRLFTTWSY